jgi:[acyl-carrier-protein] S-malonyltransferase
MVNWATTAFVFPGQGSQSVGMGKELAAAFPIAAQTFQEGDAILETALSSLMFEGGEAVLAQTIHTQPAMYINSVALLRVMQQQDPMARPSMVAGHSLGEVTAVTASGALPFSEGVALVKQRARLMQLAGEESKGGMAAILNLAADELASVCAQASYQTGKTVVLANDNSPGQIVISGDEEALELAMELAKQAGARRALRLNVSTANHSPLMKSAEDAFLYYVEHAEMTDGSIPVYANLTAQPIQLADDIQEELSQQLTRQVRWTETIQNMVAAGAQTFVEIGNKDVLSGLIKRIDANVTTLKVSDVASLEAFLSQ